MNNWRESRLPPVTVDKTPTLTRRDRTPTQLEHFTSAKRRRHDNSSSIKLVPVEIPVVYEDASEDASEEDTDNSPLHCLADAALIQSGFGIGAGSLHVPSVSVSSLF